MNREYQLENEEFRRKRAEREQEEFNKARKDYVRSIARKKRPRSLNLTDNDILGLKFEDERWERAWGLEEPYMQGYEERERI